MKKIILFFIITTLCACGNDSIGKRIHVIKLQRLEYVKFNDNFDKGLLKAEELVEKQGQKYEPIYKKMMHVKNSTLKLESLINLVLGEATKKGITIENKEKLKGNDFSKLLNNKILSLIRADINTIFRTDYNVFTGYPNIQKYIKQNFNYDNFIDANGNKSDYYQSLLKMNSIQILSDLEFIKYNCARYKDIVAKTLIVRGM